MATLANERIQYEARLKTLLEALGATEAGGTISVDRLSIINMVKAKLDELVPEGEGLTFSLSAEPNVSNPLDLLINAHLEEATKDVILSAPLSALMPVASSETEGTPFTEGGLTGYIPLPDDFLRLVYFKLLEWKRGLTELIRTNDPKYKLQSSDFLRGGIAKPVAALNWRSTTEGEATTMSKVIEYYSVLEDHSIEQLTYVCEMLAEDFVEANPSLYPSLAWMCAGKIMLILGLQANYQEAMGQVKLSYINL